MRHLFRHLAAPLAFMLAGGMPNADPPAVEAAREALRAAGHSEQAIREAEAQARKLMDEALANFDTEAFIEAVPDEVKQALVDSMDRQRDLDERARTHMTVVKHDLAQQGYSETEIWHAEQEARQTVESVHERLEGGESPADVLHSFGIAIDDVAAAAKSRANAAAAKAARADDDGVETHSGEGGGDDLACTMAKAWAYTKRLQCESTVEHIYQNCLIEHMQACYGVAVYACTNVNPCASQYRRNKVLCRMNEHIAVGTACGFVPD